MPDLTFARTPPLVTEVRDPAVQLGVVQAVIVGGTIPVVASIGPSDVRIGAVELQDSTTTTRATISAANAGPRALDMPVLEV